jgi:hypothetical protein
MIARTATGEGRDDGSAVAGGAGGVWGIRPVDGVGVLEPGGGYAVGVAMMGGGFSPIQEALRVQFAQEVATWVRRGYRVQMQTDLACQLTKPKQFSWFWFLVWLVLGWGVGGLFYILYHAFIKRERSVYIQISPDGRMLVQRD